jgi:hypothetical protein
MQPRKEKIERERKQINRSKKPDRQHGTSERTLHADMEWLVEVG